MTAHPAAPAALVTTPDEAPVATDHSTLAAEAVALVEKWLREARSEPEDAAAQRLAGVLRDPNGLDFTVGFVDDVVRPEDVRVAARSLRRLQSIVPKFLPLPLRLLLRAGAEASRVAPALVVPIARAVLRHMVRHLIVDATDRRLGHAIQHLQRDGSRLNINLLGEAILGEEEAARRIEGTRALLSRDDVDYVSIKVSATVAPHSSWSFDDAVTHAVDALRPLYRIAATAPAGAKFINLDMEEYKDLDLTLAVFFTLLDEPEFRSLEAGIVLQAYLPDALRAMMRVQEWAAARVAAGGAPAKVRVVKGANLPMERVDAEMHDWPLATWSSKLESDVSYKSVLDYALRPERTANVRIGVAGHNLFDIAFATLLAKSRGVTEAIDIEMLLGMATAQAAVVRRDVGGLLLYTPVVHPAEFDVAIAYLIRRLEEGAASENFMSAVFDLDTDPTLFARERDRFLQSIDAMTDAVPAAHRVQDRTAQEAAKPASHAPFRNSPDTDMSVAANRAWAADIRSRVASSTLGDDTVAAHRIDDSGELRRLVDETVAAGPAWQALGADARAEILHRAGDELERRRGELLEVMASECGKVLDQGDPEVSEAVDFAHHYAELGRALETVDGARFTPARLIVVAPPWNFPVAIPAGSALSALAAGSPVVLKPAPAARRSAAVLAEALWAAGIPREALRLAIIDDDPFGSELIAHPAVERIILTGAYETAELFGRMRPDVRVLGETSGKNALIITSSADLDLAARDLAQSAFGHAGQKCSAASLGILVGSAATSKRFRRQLIDAVQSQRVGLPGDEAAQIGPLIGPAEGKLARALTTLGEGESWVITPEKLDDDGMLWRPGVREGVRPGSEFHRTEYFGPVLGLMSVDTLEEAIALVNEIDYGLTSGLHSLDEDEIQQWLGSIEAGNLYVNRGITGAIVQRQPFGGWRKSSVGGSTKAGGPNYLVPLGDWQDAPVSDRATAPRPHDSLSVEALAAATHAGIGGDELAWLRDALRSDVSAFAEIFTTAVDATGLESESNVLRYHSLPGTVRVEDASAVQAVRVIAAGIRASAPLVVSSAVSLPDSVARWARESGVQVEIEPADAWATRASRLAREGGRIRLIGGDRAELSALVDGSQAVAIIDGDVVTSGYVSMLPFVREQAVSITAHRFGTVKATNVPSVLT